MSSRKSKQKRRKRNRLYREQDGKCHYCKKRMNLRKYGPEEKLGPKDATFEHLDSRFTGKRVPNRPARVVLACRKCNHDRCVFECTVMYKEVHEAKSYNNAKK